MNRVRALILVLVVCGCAPARDESAGPPPPLPERPGAVALRGTPLTLLGAPVGVGDVAPEFRVVDAEFEPVRLSDFQGKAVLISAVPSLDTGVCAAQTKRFNDEAAALPPNVAVLTLSMDLPFAQQRFCEAEGVERIRVLSDHVWRSFGRNYGVLIQGRGLLARSVFVIGKDGRIAYKQLVQELSKHPDYDAALSAAREAAKL